MEPVERDTELAALDEHLRAAADGRGRLVLVGGEAGVGKTTLLGAFAESHAGRARFAWGACDGRFTRQPLAPVADLAEELGGELATALADGRSGRELYAAALETLSSERVVALIEDVHWADEATLDLLRFVGRRLGRSCALVVATYRDEEVGPQHPLRVVMGDLATQDATRRIELRPLSQAGVAALAAGSALDANELHRLTLGNPFFVVEVLRSGGLGVPNSVRDAVQARAARLGDEARGALDAAALIGARAEVPLLLEVTGGGSAGLDECVGAALLQVDGDTAAFRHELSRRAIEEGVPPGRAAELHGRILAALVAGGGDDSARLAHHAEGAGDGVAARRYAAEAAEQAAQVGAHREAAEQLARALRFADGLPRAEYAELLDARARECYLTDEVDEALAAMRELLDLYRGLGDRRAEGATLCWLSRAYYLAARYEDVQAAAAASIEVLESLPPSRELAWAYAHMAQHASVALERDEAATWARRAIELAEELGEQDVEVFARITVGLDQGAETGDPSELERARERALELGLDDLAARAYGSLTFWAVRNRNWAAADHWIEAGLAFTTEHDLEGWRVYLLGWRAQAALDRGRWDDAVEDARLGLVDPRKRLSRVWPLYVLGQVRMRRGDPGSDELYDEVWQLVENDPDQKLAPLAVVWHEAAYLSGRGLDERLDGRLRPVRELTDRWIAGELAVWKQRSGEPVGDPGPVPEPCALELAGDHEGAGAAWQALDCPYEAALALAHSDDLAALNRGHAALLELGARPAAAIVARRLRERGVRGVRRGPRPATRAHPAGLTPRELEVVRLLEQGLRNTDIAERLVISQKTVGHHVSAILAKLGVASRAEAVRALAASENREPATPR